MWQRDYVHLLLERNQMIYKQTKYTNKRPPIKEKIVFMYDENTMKNQWRSAQIVENIIIRDENVRVARIQWGDDSIVYKPINHLFFLKIPITAQASFQDIIQPDQADPNLQAKPPTDFL